MNNKWQVVTWGQNSFTVLHDERDAFIYGVFENNKFYEKDYKNKARITPKSFKHSTHEEAFTKYPEAKEIYLKECIKRI